MANPEHLAKLKEGVAAWNKWREENPGIKPDLSEGHLAKSALGRQNIFEGIDLNYTNLAQVDFGGADLTGAWMGEANLKGANLVGAKLCGAWFSRSDLSGARLDNTDLTHGQLMFARLIDAQLFMADLRQADLSGASLLRASLVGANVAGASLRSSDLAEANINGLRYLDIGRQLEQPLWRRVRHQLRYRRRVMRGNYRGGVRGLSSCYGNRIFVRDAADQDYLDTVESQLRGRWGKFWFWAWGLTDYGRSIMSVVVIAAILIVGFGLAYSHFPKIISAGDRSPTAFTPYYFSIVTYTTLGFGDVKPNNFVGEILVAIEVIFGYVTLGLLLAVLGDRIARRSQARRKHPADLFNPSPGSGRG